MSTQIDLWVDGRPLDSLTPYGWGELEWSSVADGGCDAASWQMDLPAAFSHPSLRRNKLVEVKAGPANLWAGVLTEPDADDDWTFTAQGLSRLAWNYLCFDSAGNTTSTPNTAIDQAIARGLPWKRPNSISSSAFAATGDTDGLNYLGDLLDAWADKEGKRWGVNADGEVYAVADPTEPTYHLTPGSGRFGLADDEYASDLYLRYMTSGAVYATAHVGDAVAAANFGTKERRVDLTPMGIITSGTATSHGNGRLAKGAARQGYTNGVEPSRYQLTTPGGQPACLAFVKAGELARMFGVLDEQGQPVPYVDFVIGEAKYQAGAQTIGLSPVGLVARDLESALAGDAA